MNRITTSVILFWALVIVYLLCSPGRTGSNEHVLSAYAMLHGHAWIDLPTHEQVMVNGRFYILHPPLAAVTMLPLVAIQGLHADQRLMCVLLAALSITLVYRLTDSWWLVAFYGFGTPLFYEGTLGASWGFCSVLSTVPTLLAL